MSDSINYLPLIWRYRQETSWTYWTFALHRLTFSTTVNSTSYCMDPPLKLGFALLALVTLRWQHFSTAVRRKDEIEALHNHLNERNADIQFSKEIEENEKFPFLGCLVSRENIYERLRNTVCRKPAHTDRLLDKKCNNPIWPKA